MTARVVNQGVQSSFVTCYRILWHSALTFTSTRTRAWTWCARPCRMRLHRISQCYLEQNARGTKRSLVCTSNPCLAWTSFQRGSQFGTRAAHARVSRSASSGVQENRTWRTAEITPRPRWLLFPLPIYAQDHFKLIAAKNEGNQCRNSKVWK
jgi:hypothetical protein